MSRTASDLNAWWAGWIIEELVQTGVTCIGVASGSRCSPLAVAAARHPRMERIQHVDERGLGYFAVGYGRATGRPMAILTTSGTAAANLLPAVCEADAARVPMLVLSADRPPELRHTHANQTLEQPGLFGGKVRWFEDVPCPDEALSSDYLRTTVDQAVYRTLRRPGGPVHLNLMFREPLTGGTEASGIPAGDGPYTRYEAAGDRPVDAGDLLAPLERGVLVIGELNNDGERRAATSIAERLGWPVFADVTSGLRFGGLPDRLSISHVDLLVPRQSLSARIDGVLHLGGRTVSKRVAQSLNALPPVPRILVTPHPERQDPDHRVSHRFECSLEAFCEGTQSTPGAGDWVGAWRSLDEKVARLLAARLPGSLSEPAVAREVVHGLPAGHVLCLANSMPVRDVLSFAPSVGREIPVSVNRGVSGIDGTVSTAAGFAAGHGAPGTLLTGDLSLLHDLNALKLIRDARPPITVVAINNDGGGIFHFLPVADDESDVFEPWFGTPHGLQFEHVARMYDLDYQCPESLEAFRSSYAGGTRSDRPTLIEVRTDRQENVDVHRALMTEIQDLTG